MPPRLIIAAVALFAAFACAGPAAARPPDVLPESVASAHVVVHYTTTGENAFTAASAEQLSGHAETAYGWYASWGYTPRDDGDGKTDIYVLGGGLPSIGPVAGPDSDTDHQTTGYILFPNAGTTPNVYAVAHELFHVIQFGIYQHEQGWLDEATAEWAGQNVVSALGLPARPNWFLAPWVPLDCNAGCPDGAAGPYRGSIFMEYLDEQYGMQLVRDAYQRGATLGAGNGQQHSLQALSEAIAARGGSLSASFLGYAHAANSGGITRLGVTDHRPGVFQKFATGPFLGRMAPVTYAVNHLAMVPIQISGAATGQAPATCSARTLTVEVALPPGVPTHPALVENFTRLVPLAMEGGAARATIPWSDCPGSSAVLVLPNGSTSLDGQPFTVTMTVADPAAAEEPPTPTPTRRPSTVTSLVVRVQATKTGRLTVRIRTKTAGTLRLTATTKRGRTTLRYGAAKKTVKRAGTVTVTVKPTKAALRRLRAARRQKVTVAVRFTPRSGKVRTVKKSLTVKAPRR